MNQQLVKSRSFLPTLLVAFLFYLPAGLLWIGRPVAGVVASIIQYLAYFAVNYYGSWLVRSDMTSEQMVYWVVPVMFGGFVYFIFSIEITLRLRPRSLPLTRLSGLPYVIGLGFGPSFMAGLLVAYIQ